MYFQTLSILAQSTSFLKHRWPKFEDGFSDTVSKPQPMKDIVDKLNFNKSKHFCFAQDTVKRIEKVTD